MGKLMNPTSAVPAHPAGAAPRAALPAPPPHPSPAGAAPANRRAPYAPPVLERVGAWHALTLQQSVPIFP